MNRLREIVPISLLWVLAFLTVAYTALGFYCLVADVEFSYPCDLRLRWVEQRLVWQRLNPQEYGHPDPDSRSLKYNVGMTHHGSGYPPWSYALNMLLVPPLDWNITRWYYAGINLVSAGLIGWWAYRLGSREGRLYAGLAVVSVFAVFPYAVCLSYGQFAILIFGFLIAYLMALERNHPWLAALFLALAFVKPSLAALLTIPPLVRREVRPLFAAVLAVASAGCVAGWLVQCDPLSMMKSFSKEVEGFAFLSHNPLTPLAQKLFGFRLGTMLTAFAGGLLALALCIHLRNDESYIRSFAACIIVSMFWSYRRYYDCVLLGFPLASLLVLAVRAGSRMLAAVYLVFGASLWIPLLSSQCASPTVQSMQAVVWTVALIAIMWSPEDRRIPHTVERRFPRGGDD